MEVIKIWTPPYEYAREVVTKIVGVLNSFGTFYGESIIALFDTW